MYAYYRFPLLPLPNLIGDTSMGFGKARIPSESFSATINLVDCLFTDLDLLLLRVLVLADAFSVFLAGVVGIF